MFSRILVPYDASPTADKAFEMALRLLAGKEKDAILHVLSVARPPEIAEDVGTEAELEHARSYYSSHFAALGRRGKAHGIAPDFHVRVGHPAEMIVEYADKVAAEVIVMGHRGRSPIERWLVGSVARAVIDHANCPVLVVR
ncbi:TRAP-T-associated universal stress protein TeaD [Cupriavidus laharis]|uniref:TRAP-T-associated universal stress protein TeaD n=1 Tax=Cupriavidus laharis TaxID=151654 RepID=A0ABN7Y738_9BURK|nr:universal stress protein [Cupriavidus laharis]CAG9168097.1 TRAP-T-associated universal stress protein TeaD [Cupriavidus laharis]